MASKRSVTIQGQDCELILARPLSPTLPATGKEATEWQDVLIVHQEGTNATQNDLIRPEGWKPRGPPHKVSMNHAYVELKVDVEVPDVRVEMDVDDVRLYLHPIRNPVTVVVSSPSVHSRPEIDFSKLSVRLLRNGSKKLLGEGVTDDGGQARIALRSDTIYPVAATIEVWHDHRAILTAAIPQNGVQGLYPADVGAVRFPPKTER